MQIIYKSKSMETVCHNFTRAQKLYGSLVAEKLLAAIQLLESATNIVDIRQYPPFHFHALKGKLTGLFAIDLGRRLGYRILLKPLDDDLHPCSNEQVFGPEAVKIVVVSVEEVTKHYE
jgi:proteic killer suppression protein